MKIEQQHEIAYCLKMQAELSKRPDAGIVQELTDKQMHEKTENYIMNLQETVEVQNNILGVIDACDDPNDRMLIAEQYGITDLQEVYNARDECAATILLLQDALENFDTSRASSQGSSQGSSQVAEEFDIWRSERLQQHTPVIGGKGVKLEYEDLEVIHSRIEVYCGSAHVENVWEHMCIVLNLSSGRWYAEGELSARLYKFCKTITEVYTPIIREVDIKAHRLLSSTLSCILVMHFHIQDEPDAVKWLCKCAARARTWLFKFAYMSNTLMYQRAIEWINAHVDSLTSEYGGINRSSLNWIDLYLAYQEKSIYYKYKRCEYYKTLSKNSKEILNLVFGADTSYDSMRYSQDTLSNIAQGILSSPDRDSLLDSNVLQVLICIIVSTDLKDMHVDGMDPEMEPLVNTACRILIACMDFTDTVQMSKYIGIINASKEIHPKARSIFAGAISRSEYYHVEIGIIRNSINEYCGKHSNSVITYFVDIVAEVSRGQTNTAGVIRKFVNQIENLSKNAPRGSDVNVKSKPIYITLGWMIIAAMGNRNPDTPRPLLILQGFYGSTIDVLCEAALVSNDVLAKKVMEWTHAHLRKIKLVPTSASTSSDVNNMYDYWLNARNGVIEKSAYFNIAASEQYKSSHDNVKRCIEMILLCDDRVVNIQCLQHAFDKIINDNTHVKSDIIRAIECIILAGNGGIIHYVIWKLIERKALDYYFTIMNPKSDIDLLRRVMDLGRDIEDDELWALYRERLCQSLAE